MSHHLRRTAPATLILAFAVVATACTSSGAASGAPSNAPATPGRPSTSPAPSTDANAIDHPTGATDIVLRYDEGGGFVMPAFAATMVPPFTLYGDGTIVFRDPTLEFPPMEGSVGRFNPLRTAKLSETQVQDLLGLALGEGGLAVARAEYRNDMIADAGTAVFTVDAGGLKKTVSVYALGLDPNMEGVPDAPARAAFAKLAQTLTAIEQGGAISATDYQPTAYRGVLLEAPGISDPNQVAWPWDDLEPADFKPDADPNGLQFAHHTLTPEQVAALGIEGFEGGLQNVTLTRPDGTTWTLSVRPLLPGEAA